MPIRTAHLFAGCGGGLLASEILGHPSTLALEQDPRRCRFIHQRAMEGWYPSLLRVHCGDIQKWDPAPWTGHVDCISAGFPCKDISTAGKGAGITGKRSGLVFEVFRAADIIRPGLIFLENSPAIRTRGRRTIIRELLARGYSYRDGTLEAHDAGAGHHRKRWWLLAANPHGLRMLRRENASARNQPPGCALSPPDVMRDRLESAILQGGLSPTDAEAIEAAARHTSTPDWSPPHIGVCRVVDGLSDRIHRIAALGDAQVPLQAALAWTILSQG